MSDKVVCRYRPEPPLKDLFGVKWEPDYNAFPFLRLYDKYVNNHKCDDWFGKGNIKITKVIELEEYISDKINMVFFGILEGQEVVFKLSVNAQYNIKETAMYEYEKALYQSIINVLLVNKITPNIIGYIGTIVCNNNYFQDKNINFKEKIYKGFKEVIRSVMWSHPLPVHKINENCMNILVLEGLKDSISLMYFGFKKYNKSREQIRAVMFQIIYTIHMFQKIKLNHNDLHPENILIVQNTNGTSFDQETYYKLDDLMFKINTNNNLVKVFDLDISHTDLLSSNNSYLARSCEYPPIFEGMITCPIYNETNDIIRFKAGLYKFNMLLNKLNDPEKYKYSIFNKLNIKKEDISYTFYGEVTELQIVIKNNNNNVLNILKNNYFEEFITSNEPPKDRLYQMPSAFMKKSLLKRISGLGKMLLTLPIDIILILFVWLKLFGIDPQEKLSLFIDPIFMYEEGKRSWRYGRTAAKGFFKPKKHRSNEPESHESMVGGGKFIDIMEKLSRKIHTDHLYKKVKEEWLKLKSSIERNRMVDKMINRVQSIMGIKKHPISDEKKRIIIDALDDKPIDPQRISNVTKTQSGGKYGFDGKSNYYRKYIKYLHKLEKLNEIWR